jgi:secondary thiamine-phosphate synthase enzyme
MAAWCQRTITLPARARGFHLVTAEVVAALPELRGYEVGLLHLLLQHTSASLTLNENADPDVRVDMEAALGRLAPDGDKQAYVHDAEGPDDMPGHLKASLLGVSLTLPIAAGRLALGTWQGVWLGEHRHAGGPRRIVATMQGAPRAGGGGGR